MPFLVAPIDGHDRVIVDHNVVVGVEIGRFVNLGCPSI